jgi:hypothetical protein
MKLFPRPTLALAACLLTGLMAFQPTAALAGCHVKGVVSHTFYGKASDIAREIRNLEGKLAGSTTGRVTLVMVEAADQADVYFYEQSGDAELQRLSWSGPELRQLRAKLDSTLLDSRGRACAGEIMKQMVRDLGSGVRMETVAYTDSLPRSQILPALASRQESGFIRLTLFHPC